MGAGFFGNILNDVIAPGINQMTGGSNLGTIGSNVVRDYMPGNSDPRLNAPIPNMPSGPQQPNYQQQPQQHQQYFQQMHKGMDSMNEALQQIEQMSMPGQQYGGGQRLGPFQGGNSGKFANAGTIGRMLF